MKKLMESTSDESPGLAAVGRPGPCLDLKTQGLEMVLEAREL